MLNCAYLKWANRDLNSGKTVDLHFFFFASAFLLWKQKCVKANAYLNLCGVTADIKWIRRKYKNTYIFGTAQAKGTEYQFRYYEAEFIIIKYE